MKKPDVLHKKFCRLCNSNNLKPVYNLISNPIGDDYVKNSKKKHKLYPLVLNLCNKCKFIQLSHVINPDIIYGDYLYVTQTSSGLPEHFTNLVNMLYKKKLIIKKSKVLEIGSNDGTLLKYIHSYYGCKVLGVDPAKEFSKTKSFKTLCDNFEFRLAKKIKRKYGNFDLIVANNVIANIDNLKDVFKGISYLLNSNGYFVMETFSLKGIVEKNLIDNIYHEHISFFTIETLVNFSKKFNLYIYLAEHIPVKGGSIRFIFSKNKKNQNIKFIKSSINKEKKLFLANSNTYLRLKNKNEINKNKILKFLQSEILKGKKISGYGASIGTTTLLYEYGLGGFIDYLFDDEKRRQNLYSPGTGIKVLSPKLLIKIMPDYVIIFAWRYSEIIIKKNFNYINKGGKFIIPLPKIKII